MPKQINWDIIRQDFIESDLTYIALASRHAVSRQSIEKRAADEGWQLLRQSHRHEQSVAIEKAEQDDEFNLDNLLKKAIALSFDQLGKAEPRSFEGVSEAFCKLAEVYFKLKPPRPPTIRQWIEKADEFGLHPLDLLAEIERQVDS